MMWILLFLLFTPAAHAQQCVSDCEGDGVVTVDELLRCINIALGSTATEDCPSCDANDDTAVTVDELIRGVTAALNNCVVRIELAGSCLQPGGDGLVPCDPGTPVEVARCDDRSRCLTDPSAGTVLRSTTIGANGEFATDINARDGGASALTVAAEIEPGTMYRYIDFGRAAAGSGAGGTSNGSVVIEPRTEAAVRLLAEAGFDTISDEGALQVIDASVAAVPASSFANLSVLAAADAATEAASQDPQVEAAIAANRTVDVTAEGTVQASSEFNSSFRAELSVDGSRQTSWFSDGDAGGPNESYEWTGVGDDLISSIAILSNAQHATPDFRTFGFRSVRIQVLDAAGTPLFDITRGLDGATDPDIEVFPNVTGRRVRLSFVGHDDPTCGGFSELRIRAMRRG